jgi:hypothetical protein
MMITKVLQQGSIRRQSGAWQRMAHAIQAIDELV